MNNRRPAVNSPQPENGRVIVAAVVIVILMGAALYVFHSLRSLPGEALSKSAELAARLRTVAAAFRTGTIETTFVNYSTSIGGSKYLQFATLKQLEVYTRREAGSLFWGELELPEIVVSATAPVEYTYYLDLDDEWNFSLEEGVLNVEAPQIRFNTPAIDASRIEFEVEESSVFRDEGAALERLKERLTSMSKRRALEQIALVRETGRREIQEFVEEWLAAGFSDGGQYRVRVLFVGEEGSGAKLQRRVEPTL
jgi:hypothetical protein